MSSPTHETTTTTLPLIPLTPFLTPTSTPESRLQTAQSLINACHSTGFVYITNHGIVLSLIEEAFSWNKKFFSLSEEQKNLVAHPANSNVYRGWLKIGGEKLPEIEGEEGKGVDYCESYSTGHNANTSQPNLWIPEEILPGYREFVQTFYTSCYSLSLTILRALSLGLTGNEEYLLDFHSEFDHELCFRYYPPINEKRVREGEVGRMGAHTDFDSFTLLWQSGEGGLEVKVDGEWRAVEGVEGAVVMNIGDVLGRWSNDYLKSTLHRVHLPPGEGSYDGEGEARMTKPRYSIPYFVVPKMDKVLKPLEGYSSEGKEDGYEPVTYKELYSGRVDGVFVNQNLDT